MASTVLVVDDSAVMRASVAYTLKLAGYEVVEARDGSDGLAVLNGLAEKNQRPIAIFTDVNMPIMDGLTFIKQVKLTSYKFVPILVLTTEAEAKMTQAGKEAGAAGWLVKPFKTEQLLAILRKFDR